MPLINTSLPNLIQGVSQQPDVVRYSGQCEEQENALSSVVDGLVKRPNTRHVGRLLETAISSNSFVHFIDRDDNEKYVILHDGTTLRAFNLNGTEATITGSADYLNASNPRNALKATTVSDTTFLVNTDKTVALKKEGDLTRRSDDFANRALLFIKQAQTNTVYGIKLANPSTLGTGGSITITTEAYVAQVIDNVPHYRHRVSDVTIDNVGSAYSGDVNVRVASTGAIYEETSIQLTVTGGSLTGYVISNAGAYGGSGSDGSTPPTLTGTLVNQSIFTSSQNYEPIEISSSNLNSAEFIASALANQIDTAIGNGIGGFTVKHVEKTNLIELQRPAGDTREFSINVTGSLGDSGVGIVHKEVASLSDLPLTCVDGHVVRVVGDVDIGQDDYYVKFRVTQPHTTTDTTTGNVDVFESTVGRGVWEEVVSPNVNLGYDPETLPVSLISVAANEFKVRTTKIAERQSGDDLTNPLASFTGRNLRSVFFFQNRLGLMTSDSVILSRSGLGSTDSEGDLVFDYSRNTVTTLLDEAPIDVSVASTKVTKLQSAIAFQENLILFSNNGQFALKGGDILTPKTVSVTPVTNFNFDEGVEPINLGSYIYFPFTRGTFTGVREFTTNATSDTYNAIEITEHVPRYIPKNIQTMAGTTSEDCLALLSADEPNTLYIYKYFFSGNEKVVSAWSKFTFTGDVRGMDFVDSTLFLITVTNEETHLVSLPLESGLKDDAGYNTYLDQRVEATVSSGSATITLPYTPDDSDEIEVYTKDGLKLSNSRVGSTITLTQAVTEDTDVWVGYKYNMKYTFSELVFKAAAGNSKSPSSFAKLKVRNGALFYSDSSSFKVDVTPLYRDTYTNVFTPNVVGSTTIGELNLDSGFYRFPIFSDAEDTKITITNDSALPSNFTSAEFESFVHTRSSRYAS